MNSNRSFKWNLTKVIGSWRISKTNGRIKVDLKFVEYAIIQWVLIIKTNIWSHALILTINWIHIIKSSQKSIWTTILMSMPIIWCKNCNLILFWCSNFLSFVYKKKYPWINYSTVLERVNTYWRGIAFSNTSTAYYKYQQLRLEDS
jgi:hypothetical protein